MRERKEERKVRKSFKHFRVSRQTWLVCGSRVKNEDLIS